MQLHRTLRAVSDSKTRRSYSHKDIAQMFVQIVDVGEKVVQVGAQTSQYLLVAMKAYVLDEMIAQRFEHSFHVQFLPRVGVWQRGGW